MVADAHDEVIVVGHSLGSVIAIDLVAGWPLRRDPDRLALVSLGSTSAVLACGDRTVLALLAPP